MEENMDESHKNYVWKKLATKITYYMILFMWNFQNREIFRGRNRLMFAGDLRVGAVRYEAQCGRKAQSQDHVVGVQRTVVSLLQLIPGGRVLTSIAH